MTDISDVSSKGLPASAALLKASAIALVIAVAVLTIAVLPAEYGIDPTGIGKRLGLTALSHTAGGESPGASRDPVWKNGHAYRSDEMTLSLAPDEGAEIKASMQAGERLVFSWDAHGGPVNVDMHGETPNAADDEYTSYWKDRNASSGHGAFVAPFAGSHGWYWKNRGEVPVAITIRTSGYYEKLFKP